MAQRQNLGMWVTDVRISLAKILFLVHPVLFYLKFFKQFTRDECHPMLVDRFFSSLSMFKLKEIGTMFHFSSR